MVTIEVCALVGFTGAARVERLGALDAILFDRACRIGAAAVALVELHPTELVVQRGRAIGETCAFRLPREGRLRFTTQCGTTLTERTPCKVPVE